ncbi:MAG: YajQ family cyclic di-GMP-binding protein [Rhodocyclaceae bacterium]|nr:YajQ family cyclic di-GMP-binding protein [Rhodocyclaceae bacterium]
MPSFDITSDVDWVALINAVNVAGRHIGNRYDFKGTSARVELDEKNKVLTLYGDSEFQLGQVKDILFPEMEKKERESTKRLVPGRIETVSGNKVKQTLSIKSGIDQELGKKIVKLLKDSKLKVQAAIQGDAVRVSGAKKDTLQEAIALVRATIGDYPLKFGNYRD